MAMPHSLTDNVQTIRALAPVVAGTSTQESAAVDTQGFDGARYIVSFGTITSGSATTVNWEDCDTSAGSYNDVAASKITVLDTDDNTLVIGQIFKPTKRFLKVKIVRATQNAVIDLVIVELYRAKQEPVTQDATVTHHKEQASPADGTA